MSLSSLKKSAQSANGIAANGPSASVAPASVTSANLKPVTVDEFIQGAQYYACGLKLVPPGDELAASDEPLKRATFTLGKTAIARLNALSASTGLAKSRLIRLWLDNQMLG